jgi:hypothetical protein
MDIIYFTLFIFCTYGLYCFYINNDKIWGLITAIGGLICGGYLAITKLYDYRNYKNEINNEKESWINYDIVKAVGLIMASVYLLFFIINYGE